VTNVFVSYFNDLFGWIVGKTNACNFLGKLLFLASKLWGAQFYAEHY